MQELEKNEKISIYGELDIKFLNKNVEKMIDISMEDKQVSEIGEAIYELLWKQYAKFDYKWEDIKKEVKTTRIVIEGNIIDSEKYINIYGYVEDRTGIPSENGKKYDFYIVKIKVKELFKELEEVCDNYICEFNTIKEGLKFVIKKIEIL